MASDRKTFRAQAAKTEGASELSVTSIATHELLARWMENMIHPQLRPPNLNSTRNEGVTVAHPRHQPTISFGCDYCATIAAALSADGERGKVLGCAFRASPTILRGGSKLQRHSGSASAVLLKTAGLHSVASPDEPLQYVMLSLNCVLKS
jgi:hypothetical protein